MEPNPDPSSTNYLFELIFLVVLTGINAFFASAEMAFVSLNKTRVKNLAQEGNKKAELLQALIEEPNKFLSTIQVAITLSGFLASASAAASMSNDLGRFLGQYGIPYGSKIALVLVTIILSYFTLVLGELFPKRIALQNADKVALFCVTPIRVISHIAAPFIKLLSVSVTGLLKLVGRDRVDDGDTYSEEEIRSLLEVGQETGRIKEAGKEMINSIFEFDDMLAYEVMTPRTEVYAIDINDPLEEYVDELLLQRYARVPFYDKDSDNIIGILFMKDFVLEARRSGFTQVNVRNILRKPYFVPESKNIDDLFRELQETKTHIAVLIDEYGGFVGIVTMEDLIEEVMGNIDDEYDDDEPKIEQLDDTTWLVDGAFDLDDLKEELDIHFESENYETIGGLVIELIGEIPEEDEPENRVVEYEGCLLTVESVKDRRIEKVKVQVPRKQEEPESQSDESEEERQ